MTQSRPSQRGWLVWGVAVTIYLVAVFHRSSLAVAGLAAADRFGISASALASFTMLQLLVYACMQIPVGLLVDRFGPRRVLMTGIVVISTAQAGFALADSYPAAVIARIFVGMGDAMTFICVLRLVSSWFAPMRVPLVTQLTGSIGQLGAVLAAVPMTWALGHLGWTYAYLAAASVGIVLLIALVLVIGDAPEGRVVPGHPLSRRALFESLRASWAQPGTRLGFWVHFSTPFSNNMMSLLWGFPFLVLGESRSATAAGTLLTLSVVATVCSGPVLGWIVGRYAWHRTTVALVVVAAEVAVWTLVLAWPGTAPLAVLMLLMVTIGLGGPASMIGFDIGRTSNPPARLASASGIINQGGFLAALVGVVAIGWLLDLRTPGGTSSYTPSAFHSAMAVQYLLWGLGALQIWRYRRRVRSQVPRDTVERGSTMVIVR